MSSYILLVAAQEGAPTSVLDPHARQHRARQHRRRGPRRRRPVRRRREGEPPQRRSPGPLPRRAVRDEGASRGVVALILLAAILIIVGVIAAGVWIVRLLGRLLGSVSRRLLAAERFQRIHSQRPARRHETRRERDPEQHDGDSDERQRVGRTDAVEQTSSAPGLTRARRAARW